MIFLFFEIVIDGIGKSNLEPNIIDPIFLFYTFIVSSLDPETIFVPSGVIATELTEEGWPLVFKIQP